MTEPISPPVLLHSDVLETPTHRLHRYFTLPKDPIARIIFLHGYGDHAGRYAHLMTWMAEHGIATQAIDFRGHGRSTGRIAHVARWEEYLDDLHALLAHHRDTTTPIPSLPSTPPSVPTYILGHSHGGLIAVMASLAGMFDDFSGVILSAPYLKLKLPISWPKRLFAAAASRLWPACRIKSGIGSSMLTRDPLMLIERRNDPLCPGYATPRWFTTTLKTQAFARASAASFKLPLLMLVAGDDAIADSNASIAFFEQCGSSDKQIKIYPDHRHELLRELEREKVFEDILGWMNRP